MQQLYIVDIYLFIRLGKAVKNRVQLVSKTEIKVDIAVSLR